MLEPVTLNISPSCFDCISWSADGDLAIAAGDHVHVLTPKPTREDDRDQQGGEQEWVDAKLQTNLFKNAEWPSMLPLPGYVFSIGEEQSVSHVVALSWSPPGLAAYRRCMLGVLTSNLVLSFWQAVDGHAQWTRVAIVNYSLQEHFRPQWKDDELLLQQKQRIRSFSWSPACAFSGSSQSRQGLTGSRQDRGRHLLLVVNDLAELIILEVRNIAYFRNQEKYPWTEVIATCQLPQPRTPCPSSNPNSLLALSFQRKRIIRHASWGPWVHLKAEDAEGNTNNVSEIGLINGSELCMLRVEASLKSDGEKDQLQLNLGTSAKTLTAEIEDAIGRVELKGPLSWIHGDDNETMGIAVGILDGLVSINLHDSYTDPGSDQSPISVHKQTLAANDSGLVDLYPVTGITQMFDTQLKTACLHVVNLSSHTVCLAFPTMESISLWPNDQTDQRHQTDWQRQADGFRSQYDLDYDLRGMSISKTWGLASYRGWIAACFSVHPTDMFEHATASRQWTRVVFARPHMGDDFEDNMPWSTPSLSLGSLRGAREKILSYILDQGHKGSVHGYRWLRRLQYAAACCVMVQPDQCPQLIPAAKSTLEWLGNETSVDLAQETALANSLETDTGAIEAPPTTIPPKTRDQLLAPGAEDIFETCDACGSGIEWYSPVESQCAEGHIFVRCGVTFLSIQDPLSTKRCSRCESEVLNYGVDGQRPQMEEDDDTGSTGMNMLDLLLDAFDPCVYCGGKFRAWIS